MKYWLSGAFTLLLASNCWAQDYQIVQSRSLKLDVWIDNVKNKSPQSWCARDLPLRIVANGKKDPALLDDFLPRVASLLQSQCSRLSQINWQMNDAAGDKVAQGSARKAQAWAPVVTPEKPAEPVVPPVAEVPPSPPKAEDLSPPADTSPWIQFSLMDGCHFRTWWSGNKQTSALFVPAKGGVSCGNDGWLSGSGQVTLIGHGASKSQLMTFLRGFPVAGLNDKVIGHSLQILTVNNQRMVLNDEKRPGSWMVLPYAPALNGFQATGELVVQFNAQDAANKVLLQKRLNEVRNLWSPYLSNGTDLTFKLVDTLSPQLQDPAAGAFSTLH